MNTQLLNANDNDINIAANILKNGGLVAIPTETVYGLAANAFNETAVKNIFIAKGRAQDNPLIVHISSINQLNGLVIEIPHIVNELAEKFWPGPLTMIMKKSDKIPDIVTCGMDTVAIRMPKNEIARKIIEKSGVPLAAPSANLSGGVSPVTAQHCIVDLSGKVEAILDGGKCNVGLESTVLLCTSNPPRLLRPGFVTPAEIESVIGKIDVDDAVLNPLKEGVKPASPGMKYKHYSPKAEVVLIDADSNSYAEYVNKNNNENTFALCFDEDINLLCSKFVTYGKVSDSKSQATHLFDCLRLLDEKGAKTVYAHMPSKDGVGLAVLNRILRAAAYKIIKL